MLECFGLEALVFVRALYGLESPLLSTARAARLADVAGYRERARQQMTLGSIASSDYGVPKISEGAFFAILVQNGPVRRVRASDRVWLLRSVAATASLELTAAACMEGRSTASSHRLRVESVGELCLRPGCSSRLRIWPQVMERDRVRITCVAGVACSCLPVPCGTRPVWTQLGDRGHLLDCSAVCRILVGMLLPWRMCLSLVVVVCFLFLSGASFGHVDRLAVASDASAVRLDLGHEFRVCALSQSELAGEQVVVVDDTAGSRLGAVGCISSVALRDPGSGVLGASAQTFDYLQNFSVVLLVSGVDLGGLVGPASWRSLWLPLVIDAGH